MSEVIDGNAADYHERVAETLRDREYVLKLTCTYYHEQEIRYKGMTRGFVELQGALMTGSPEVYKYPPGADDPLGKCGLCRHEAGKLVPLTFEVLG